MKILLIAFISVSLTACASKSKEIKANAILKEQTNSSEISKVKVPVYCKTEILEMLNIQDHGNIENNDYFLLLTDHQKINIHSTYTRSLRKYPGLGGKVTLRFIVLESGEIESTCVVSEDVNNYEFLETLVLLFSGWKFNNDIGAKYSIEYPIEFLPP